MSKQLKMDLSVLEEPVESKSFTEKKKIKQDFEDKFGIKIPIDGLMRACGLFGMDVVKLDNLINKKYYKGEDPEGLSMNDKVRINCGEEWVTLLDELI